MDPLLNTVELLVRLGDALRSVRLQQNLGQVELAARAGVSRSAVQNLEAGRGTVETLVRVVRALGREDWLAGLHQQTTVNPLHMVRSAPARRRASKARRGRPTP